MCLELRVGLGDTLEIAPTQLTSSGRQVFGKLRAALRGIKQVKFP